ncbi:MAG: AAA family ATPase [Dehalococcoidia bacterium]|nr:AAA family ATPase [Dehalococcoidia bacterium]
MNITRAKVTNYRSIDDSGWVSLDNVTTLVGKNESGKTAFLQALRRLNPVGGANGKFDIMDYPRKGYVRYKRRHETDPDTVIQAEFKLTREEMSELESRFGPGVLRSPKVIASKNYKNQRSWEVDIDEEAVIRHVIDSANLPEEIHQFVGDTTKWDDLYTRLQGLEVKPTAVQVLLSELTKRFNNDLRQQIVLEHLERYLPEFVYFDNYSTMRGRISIQDIKDRRFEPDELDESDRTFLALISLVGADLDDLEQQQSFEYLKAELESASIGISDEIFEFWRQNTQLRVEFDISQANPNDPPPLNAGPILHVRIWNDRHRVSVPFDERSKGFVWFFSFLVYFSEIEEMQNGHMVLLLDEPGLNLHAMAQYDFLRFIDERLAPKHQVVYTTHSPFMINLNNLPSVRTVEDMDEYGTVITDDVLQNSRDTVFPLQTALGYQMAETLFLAPHCLLVNSPSDLIYLQVLGEFCATEGRAKLDPRWVIIPVGKAENLPAFISLLGDNYTSLAVLMDVTPASRAHIESINDVMVSRDSHRSPIKWVEVTRVRDADLEDLLDPGFYVKLVNAAYKNELPQPLTLRSISESNPRIAERVKSYFSANNIAGGNFETYRPAAHFLQNHGTLRQEINQETMDSVAGMFERINSLLPTNGAGSGHRLDAGRSTTLVSGGFN